MRGFTLIEIVVAIFLVGLLIVVSGSVLTAPQLARHSKYEDAALTVAADKLESLRSGGYDALPASGSFTSSGIAALPQGSGSVTVSTYSANVKQVAVTVQWIEPEATTTSNVALTTLITKTGGLP